MSFMKTLTKVLNGLRPNDGTGDDLRSGADKINGNWDVIADTVNSLAASQGSGVKPYATLAALTADTTQANGTVAVVYADPTAANNTSYVRQSGAWTAAYDRLTYALGNGSGFQQGAPGSVLLTVQDALRNGIVDVKRFGAKGDGTTDDSNAIMAALSQYSHVYFPEGNYVVTKPIPLKSGGKIRGASATATVISCASATAGFVLSAPVGIANAVQGCDISDMLIDGPSANTGLVLQSTYRVRLSRVTFRGFNKQQLSITQLWDSWFEDCYWRNNNTGNTTAAVTISNGTGGDNSNNLRFFGCTWETLQAGAIRSMNEASTSSYNYNYFFNGCKWEGCNLAQVAPAITEFTNGGSGAHEGIAFKRTQIAFLATETTKHAFVTGVGVVNLSVDNLDASFKSVYTAPFVSLNSGRGTYIKNVALQDTGGTSQAGTSYLFHNITGCVNAYFENLMLNNVIMANGSDTVISAGAEYGTRYTRFVGTEAQRLERQNSGFDGMYQTQVANDGTVTETTSFNGTATPSGGVRIMSKNAAASGSIGAALVSINGSLRAEGGAWNNGKLLLGSYRIWVDSSGRLRIKSGDPSSDTDGTIVGAQT